MGVAEGKAELRFQTLRLGRGPPRAVCRESRRRPVSRTAHACRLRAPPTPARSACGLACTRRSDRCRRARSDPRASRRCPESLTPGRLAHQLAIRVGDGDDLAPRRAESRQCAKFAHAPAPSTPTRTFLPVGWDGRNAHLATAEGVCLPMAGKGADEHLVPQRHRESGVRCHGGATTPDSRGATSTQQQFRLPTSDSRHVCRLMIWNRASRDLPHRRAPASFSSTAFGDSIGRAYDRVPFTASGSTKPQGVAARGHPVARTTCAACHSR